MERLGGVHRRPDHRLMMRFPLFFFSFLLFFLTLPVEEGWAGLINQCIRPDGERIFRNAPCRKGEQTKSMPAYPTRRSSSPEAPMGPVDIPLLTVSRPGSYWVEVELNSTVKVKMLVDTGATDLFLPEEVYEELKRGLTMQDDMGMSEHTIADGSVVKARSFHVQQIALGGRRVNHVIASISHRGITPLLGANVLERFGKWHIDAEKKRLVLEEEDGEKQANRDAQTGVTCLEQRERVESNGREMNQLVHLHNQEAEKLQQLHKQIHGEGRLLVRNALVEEYNRGVDTINQDNALRTTNRKALWEDSKRQSESYNIRCPGRPYQGENGVWKRFPKFQLTLQKDAQR